MKNRSQPISRVLSRTTIHLGRASPHASCDLPGSDAGRAKGSLFGLAPGGVYPAVHVTANAVRSYRTFSPLPAKGPKASPQAVCFLWHFPSARAAQMLSGTLPCGARTFLRPVPPAAPKGLAADTGTAVVRPTPGRNLIAVCG